MTNEEIFFLKSLVGNVGKSAEECDIKAVFLLAQRHNVLPLCYENISNMGVFDLKSYEKLQSKVFATVFSQTKRTANFKKIYSVLIEEGIKPLVLKGIICRNLYGELCDHRPSGDEDILIKKEDYFRVEDVLKANGYIPAENVNKKTLSGKQEVTFKSSNGLNIEVHLNIIGTENSSRRQMNQYFENVFDKAVSIEIGGQEYFTLDYTDHYIYLFYHMFKHFAMTGVGVRQILDMFKFGTRYFDKIEWDRVNEAIKMTGGDKLYGDVLEIGRLYWGFSFENKFGVSFPDKLIEDMFSSGAYGNETKEQSGSKVKVMAAMETGGKHSRIRSVFPSIEAMREFYTVLYKHPYLLPVMWLVRIVRYIFRSKSGKTYNVLKSEKIADKKIQLLRDYKII